ncbi:MAG: helix-turn-helix transcriptional regulator [Xanthomonadaceae bacterium]|nr:helix-turn-helix transcriptional regulator [Xanthomonadaceae bacterium]
MHHPNHPTPAGTFSDRIKLLIQRVGSATEIARMCGFSEGVVRSWRDGNTDPSRGRCVTLARTLGISLVWLVAGEGGIQVDPAISAPDEQHTTEMVPAPRSRARSHPALTSAPLRRDDATVDAQRLETAMKILQSQLELAGGHLTLAGNSDMLAELYAILGPNGVNVDTDAMVDFNHRLAERIRQNRDTA